MQNMSILYVREIYKIFKALSNFLIVRTNIYAILRICLQKYEEKLTEKTWE